MLLPGACGSVPPAVTITRRDPRFNQSTAYHPTHPGCWSLPSVSRLTSSPPWAPPAVARSAWLFEKVTVVHRTGRNGVRSIARTHSSDQVCAIVPRAKFPSRVLTRRFRFLFYNFPGSDGARFRMVRTGVCRRCGHMGRHYLGASAFLVPRWPHHPEWDRCSVKAASQRLVVFAIELHYAGTVCQLHRVYSPSARAFGRVCSPYSSSCS